MRHFIESIEKSLVTENWYAALLMALSVPDICGRTEDPDSRPPARYVKWFDKYMLTSYQHLFTMPEIMREYLGGSKFEEPELKTFLCGSDCYALRCAFLHQGEFLIDGQNAQKVLSRFQFIYPPGSGGVRHMNTTETVLQLQVDIFCRDICRGISQWLIDVADNGDISQRLSNLAVISDFRDVN